MRLTYLGRTVGGSAVVLVESRGDAQLLKQWAGGDTSSGDELVRRHFGPVFRVIRRRAVADAEDLTQRAFELALAKHAQLRDDSTFRAFVFGIVRHLLMANARKRAHEPINSNADLAASYSRYAELREERKVLMRALSTLPLDLQIAVDLFYWEGLTVAEIAQAIESPPGTVKSRLWRARDQLRETIAKMDVGDALRRTTIEELESWAKRRSAEPGADPSG